MIDFSNGKRLDAPFPHVYFEQVFGQTDYSAISREFPTEEFFQQAPSLKSRADFNIYEADQCYSEVIAQPALGRLHHFIKSEKFLTNVITLFQNDWDELGLKLDKNQIRTSEFVEGRGSMLHGSAMRRILHKIRGFIEPKFGHQLFTRLDFSLSGPGYGKPPHVDNENRVAAALIYLSDGEEDEIEGGELCLYATPQGLELNGRRTLKESELGTKTIIPIKKNSAVFFPCHPLSFHGVSELVSAKSKRRFFYLSISSQSFSIWKNI